MADYSDEEFSVEMAQALIAEAQDTIRSVREIFRRREPSPVICPPEPQLDVVEVANLVSDSPVEVEEEVLQEDDTASSDRSNITDDNSNASSSNAASVSSGNNSDYNNSAISNNSDDVTSGNATNAEVGHCDRSNPPAIPIQNLLSKLTYIQNCC